MRCCINRELKRRQKIDDRQRTTDDKVYILSFLRTLRGEFYFTTENTGNTELYKVKLITSVFPRILCGNIKL